MTECGDSFGITAKMNSFEPSTVLRGLVQKSMLAYFAADKFTTQEREDMLHSIQQTTRTFAKRLLLAPEATHENDSSKIVSNREATNDAADGKFCATSQYILPPMQVAPPCAYFSFRENGRMHLPIVDWSSFRGYSVAMWINIDFLVANTKKQQKIMSGTKPREVNQDEDIYAKFNLFRFVNGSNTLGVEAALEYEQDNDSGSGGSVLLSVSSCAPSSNDQQRRSLTSASILNVSMSGRNSTDWKRIQHRIHLVSGQWHLLVISHSLHYVKKSKVTCHVDAKLQFREELAYPSSLVTASKCTIGGGRHTAVKIASASMYQEEISKELIGFIYSLGPMVSLFNRWEVMPQPNINPLVGGLYEATVPPSSMSIPSSEQWAAFCKLQVVFSFTAKNMDNEDYADLGVEWLSEGSSPGSTGKWVTMESTIGMSAEIQQRHAKLGKNVEKIILPDNRAAWFRSFGVSAIPVLLHYILAAYEKLSQDLKSLKRTESVQCKREPPSNTVESIVVDLLWILKGILLHSATNQKEALQNYVFHTLSHVMVQHKECLSVIWTPGSLVVCIEMVKSLFDMIPARQPELLLSVNHPFQRSIWESNPLFASGVRALLLDYRWWTATDFKTQSIFNHQLYSLACEFPRMFNDVQTVPKILEILRSFYSTSVGVYPNESKIPSRTSQNSKVLQEKDNHWMQQCVQTLVEVMEVCLTNQSVQVHEVLEQELMETTFAQPSSQAGNIASSTSSGNNTSISSSGNSSYPIPVRQGGVFSINLENIVWSDQNTPLSTGHAEVSTPDDKDTKVTPPTSVLGAIQVRFSLLRDIRAIIRFLMTNQDPVVSTSILLLLRRLAVSFLDMRFALVSSNIMDCLLYLMHRPDSVLQRVDAEETHAATLSIRMACIPLFIYLLDWLESIEGRTVWCGLEENLRMIFNGEGSFSIGFLELMMEFYFDPSWLLGVQHSIIMNDPFKKESVLFPISSPMGKTMSMHESGVVISEDPIPVSSTGIIASSELNGSISGLAEWIKIAGQFVGKRLALSWEKRVAVIRKTALRNLTTTSLSVPLKMSDKSPLKNVTDEDKQIMLVADIFDEGVSGILNLPMRGILPFLPILLARSSAHFREKVLMDINVKLKTDESVQQQLLLMKKDWAEALLELSLACSCQADNRAIIEDGETDDGSTDEENDEHSGQRGRAYSYDARKTGEDLVLDTIVSLLSMAMNNRRGWRSFTDLILALKVIRIKYDTMPPTLSSGYHVRIDRIRHAELYTHTLDWLCRVTGIVLQRMARSRTILSRMLAENVQKVLFLVHETLLVLPLKKPRTPAKPHQPGVSSPPSSQSIMVCVWSDAQHFLLTAVHDICLRLTESTHKMHRIGLFPGLQILQHALPYTSSASMIERIVGVLVTSFQQEMSPGAAMRVYETTPIQEVFLSALVCLRRALLVQESEDVLVLLRGLTLRICTSGSFADELHTAGISVQSLSEMTEPNAVVTVLDVLALLINEREMHEREEEADMVPHFPIAKELRNSHQRFFDRTLIDEVDHQANSSDSAAANNHNKYVDENEQLIGAALEVEENRMMETVRNVQMRETHRALTESEVYGAHQLEWTERLWLRQEFNFRTQNQHYAIGRVSSSTLRNLQESLVYRLGVYETSFPTRMRGTLDVDLTFSSLEWANAEKTASDDASSANIEGRRRQLSLPLEIAHSLEPDSSRSPMNSPTRAKANELLLEQVGRVVAQQRGGEIHDITIDEVYPKPDSIPKEDVTTEGTATINDEIQSTADDAKEYNNVENAIPYSDKSSIAEITGEDKAQSRSEIGTTHSEISGSSSRREYERLYASSFDPGAGIAVSRDDQVAARATCRRVIPEGIVPGYLYFGNKHLIFEPHRSVREWKEATKHEVSDRDSFSDSRTSEIVDEVAPGLHRCWRWKYRHIVGVYLRRYRLRDSALEIFLRNGSNHFLDFPLASKQQRNELTRLLYSYLPRHIPKQWPGRPIPHLASTTKAWQNRQISNFDYLMALNTFAGRSFNDLTQYPVFPWILTNYEDETLDLSDVRNFRDLSKPMGALNPTRLQEYWERYNSFDDPVIPKFLYGSHYSTCAGVVLFFLFRLQPFAELHQKMQGGCFDLPDRLFYSIQETWEMCNSQMSEVKELTPEFYCDGNFLKNINGYDFGKRHDSKSVSDVQLPKWAKNSPEEFIKIHRAALESEYVSRHLHEWIDLIFGYKQRGRAALKANNVFYYLTYYGVVDLDRIEDPFLRESMELQIAHFGQCPMQLFGTPHPKRNAVAFGRKSPGVGTTLVSPGSGGSSRIHGSLLTSPGSSGGNSSNSSSGSVTNIPRPLSLSFQDFTPSAQEKRKHWSDDVVLKAIAHSGIRVMKVLPDRILSVNELGVIEMYNWKLVPKTQVSVVSPSSSLDENAFPWTPEAGEGASNWEDGSAASDTEDEKKPRSLSRSASRSEEGMSEKTELLSPAFGPNVEVNQAGVKPTVTTTTCPWLLEAVRDDSPFDYVPRIPVFDDSDTSTLPRGRRMPIAISMNGRIIVSGGARNGAIHLRLIDLDNGHVIGKASVVGHDDAVTCLWMDKWTYSTPPSQQEEEQILLSGSKDGTLALWRLSRVKQDLLFRLPRIYSSPIMILRGHSEEILDCCISTYLGLVISCSRLVGMAHFIYNAGDVAFVFEPASAESGVISVFSHVRLSVKGYILAVTRMSRLSSVPSGEVQVIGCVCQMYNLSGVLLSTQKYENENIVDVQFSAEGDLVILTVFPGTIRICRAEDFVVVQEYESPATVNSSVSATCFGPREAVILIALGHEDGTISLQLLPDADGSVSFLTSVRRLLGVNSRLKMVRGTVQQAQNLAMNTFDSAKAVTSTARDIAGEALGEAKSMMRGFISYLQKQSQS